MVSKDLDNLRNFLNDKRREKVDQFWLSLFNAAIMFLSIATPLFMTADSWTDSRKICVKISIVCMVVVVVALLIVLRRLVRYYKGVLLEMMPAFNGQTDSIATSTREWVWYEKLLSRVALLCFLVGIGAVFYSVFI